MFDIGWTEMMVIVIIAIFVIGPKDLPKVLRALGRWVRKARVIAREFQNSVDDMLRESELDELKKEAEQVSRIDPLGEVKKAVDPTGEIEAALRPERPESKPAPRSGEGKPAPESAKSGEPPARG
jgi:sec-independent protein translocase protein TatB